ncbi:hypothetical protein [Streptomyces cyaneofuscatus]|uniref:hypothetical protein n=1 Tax=Streptomyces cyaneofuscatus TaxID=66883 RepID=UPI003660A5F8
MTGRSRGVPPNAPGPNPFSAPAPPVSPALTAAVRRAHETSLGAARVLDAAPATATEDFPHFAAGGVETAYCLLGTTGVREWRARPGRGDPVPPNHAPGFAPDVRTALPTGVTALAAAARQVLDGGPGGGGNAGQGPGWVAGAGGGGEAES